MDIDDDLGSIHNVHDLLAVALSTKKKEINKWKTKYKIPLQICLKV